MATYLVTGGAGFIGSNLVKALLADGHTVRIIDDFSAGRMEKRIDPKATYITGDIRNPADLDKAMAGVDGVFHTAAIPRMSYSVEHPLETSEVNVMGTIQVLEAARRNKVKRVVYSASSSAYGNQKVMPFVETMKACPMSPYGLQKFIGEEYCRIYAELYGLQTVSLRYFNVYGPMMDPEGPYALVVGMFLRQRTSGQPLTITGDGEYFRDYTHVTDIVRGNILAMQNPNVGNGEVFNLGNGKPYSVNQLADLIGGERKYIPRRPGDPRKTEADRTKSKEILGWEPTIGFPEGIAALKQEWGIV